MKAIQVMMDEELLHRLDADPDVAKKGRSAVLRLAVEEYLRRRHEETVAELYRQGYTQHPPDEFEDWGDAAAGSEE